MLRTLIIAMITASVAVGAGYDSPDNRVQFEYDETAWMISDRSVTQTDPSGKPAPETLVSLERKTADENYRARFSVVREDAAKFKDEEGGALPAYHRHALEFLKSQRFGNIQVDSGKNVLPRLGAPAIQTTANQRDFGLTFRQAVFIDGNDAYLLTAAIRTSKFEEQRGEIDRIFATFRLER